MSIVQITISKLDGAITLQPFRGFPNKILAYNIKEYFDDLDIAVSKLVCWDFKKSMQMNPLSERRGPDHYLGNGNINYIAIMYNNFELLKWAHSLGYPLDSHISSTIALSGDQDMLVWAISNGCTLDKEVYCAAVERGDLEMIKLLHNNNCPTNHSEQVCSLAALHGHLGVLKWCRENGLQWDKWVCIFAGLRGYLMILKYAVENGCPWDKQVCIEAAKGGHLKIIKYAVKRGYALDEAVCIEAAKHGQLEILKYAVENGCQWDPDQCTEAARECEDLETYGSIIGWVGEWVIDNYEQLPGNTSGASVKFRTEEMYVGEVYIGYIGEEEYTGEEYMGYADYDEEYADGEGVYADGDDNMEMNEGEYADGDEEYVDE
jgi:hypothetical protein